MNSKISQKISFSLILILAISNTMAINSVNLRTRPFDNSWSFKKENMTSGPEKSDFDVSSWRKVDLPHDWGTEDVQNQIPDSIVGPFVKSSPGGTFDGFISGGQAWYRNTFKTSKEDQGKMVYLQFDGVYMNSDVWVNGHHLGNHPYGYTPFYYDLTPFLQPVGQDNIIAVQVRNEGSNSRWYSGAGIYRHVWLTVVNPIHVDVWGVFVTTPKVSKSSADAQVVVTIKNAGKEKAVVTLLTQLIDASGKLVGSKKSNATITADSKTEAKQIIPINNPQLWSPQSPSLYKAKVTVMINNKEVDNISTTFGVRDIKIDAKYGLLINGVSAKMKGGCIHHDYGPLGSAAIDRAEERKIELLKANGFNAIRLSHNPPSQTFLDICDRLGMLVIDEAFDTWIKGKFGDDYHLFFKDKWNEDLTSMILRDRNHPSVILWSIGNEIPGRADSTGLATTVMLKRRVQELDPTRMVTDAVCDFWDARRSYNWDEHTPAIFKLLDVSGYNYMQVKYEADHQKYPERIIAGTESHPMKALEIWSLIEKNPYIIGDFVWTAMDYRGEAGCGYSVLAPITKKNKKIFVSWPWFNAYCGDLDFVGDKKPQSYYRDVVWRRSKIELFAQKSIPEGMVEFVNDWGWPNIRKSWSWPGEEGQKLKVFIYTRCQSVKLELNGKIIGEQKVPENSITVTFEVPYQAGILIAKGYDNGKEVVSTQLKTVGSPVEIHLKADRKTIKANRNDLSYVSVEIVDAAGNVVPDIDNMEVSYSISGNGELAGVGNGNPIDATSFQQPRKKVFQGRGQVIIRPKGGAGKIVLKAAVKGLKDGLVELTAK
jgi:beta-galactosidase